MELTQISDFKIGRLIQGFFLCKEKHLRQTKNDNLYLDMVLSDPTGSIHGKMWNLVDNFQDRFESGDPVAIKGKVSEFNDELQLTVTQINLASYDKYSQYGFSPEKLVKNIDESIVDLWDRLLQISNILTASFKELVCAILNRNKGKIQTIPISLNHHPIRGSYLKHLVIKSEIAIEILKYYPSLNRDLVLSGILLYDIGTVKSINDNLIPGYTNEGKLIGHVILGRDIILEAARSLKNISSDMVTKLEHIILTQNETNEIIETQFPEALFVHYINKLDERINVELNAINIDKP